MNPERLMHKKQGWNTVWRYPDDSETRADYLEQDYTAGQWTKSRKR